MAELTYRAAIRRRRSPRRWSATRRVVLIGEDVGAAGGVFKLTEGLFDRFGPERVRDTPISEQAIVGAAMGAAMTGLRPIAELMFSDFFAVTWDMVANQIAKTRYMTDGQVSLPLVLRTANGGGPAVRRPAQPERRELGDGDPRASRSSRRRRPPTWSGLMAAAIRDPDPVIFCEHKALFADKGEVPDGEHRRHARARRAIVRAGHGRHDRRARGDGPQGASRRPTGSRPSTASTPRSSTCARSSRSTPRPILASVAKTSRLFTVEENPRLCGWGAEIASIVADEGFYSLDAPIVRITTPHIPLPSARGARGPRDAVGRADRRDRPAPAGRRRVRQAGDAEPTVAVLGTGRMGSAMAERLAGAGRRRSSSTTGRRTGRAALAGEIGAPGRRHARPRRPRAADVVITMVADDAAVRALYDGPDGVARRAPRRARVAVDMSTVLPDTIRSVAPAVPARAAPGSSTRRSRAASRSTAGRRADDHGRRRGGGPRAGPAGPRSPRATRLPPRAARDRRGDEARGQHADLRAQRRRRRGPRPGRAERHRPGARLRRPRRERRRGAVVGYKRAAFVEPETTPVAFSLALADKDLRLIARARRGARPAACRRPPSTSTRSGRPRRRWARPADFPPSPDHLRSGGPALTDRPEQGTAGQIDRRPARDRDPATRGGTIDDRPDRSSRVRSSSPRTPTLGELPGADVLIEDDRIVAVGPDLSADGAQVDRRHRRHRHPGLHRHPSPHLGDVDPDLRAGLRAGHLLRRRSSTSSRPHYRPDDVLRRQPVGRARVHQRGHHDARRLVAHHEHAGPRRRGDPRASRSPASGRSSPTASGTRRSRTGGSGRTTTGSVLTIDGDDARRIRKQYFNSDDGRITMALATRGTELLQARRRPPRLGAGQGARAQHHGPRRDGPVRLHEDPDRQAPRHGPPLPEHDLRPRLALHRRGVGAGPRLGRQRLVRAADRGPDGPRLGARR